MSATTTHDDSRYELEGVHARGGIGRVVVAHDRRLNRTVAIKELLERTPSAEARFVREALIAARLQHPGVVPIHEAGRWPSGEPYYAMKLVSGRTLKELIADRAELDERLALLPKVLAVAETIAYAHSENVLHRDIKPANVVVGDFGETVVVDWGLAKDLSGDVDEPMVAEGEPARGSGDATGAGNVMGTPSYMAPEQARGEDVDARADVFALGALLYELLCGRPPYLGEDADAILAQALEGKAQPVDERQPDVPPDLCAIVRKAMAADPADRYPSAAPLAEDIRRFQTGQLVSARHYSTRTLIRRWIGRHRAGVAVVSAAALVAIAMGAIGFGRVVAERNEAQQQRVMAERAQAHAEDRSHELVFLQAQSRLARDPTAALAWLKNYPLDGRRAERLPAMIDEAIAMGVSTHVLPHGSWVMMVDFVDRDRVVTTDMRGVLRIFDVHSGKSRAIADVGGKVWRAVLAPDRRTVALGHFSGAIELVDLVTGEITRLVEETHDKTIDWVGFSGDGRRLASWSMDRELVVWNTASGERVFRREADVTAADLSADGRHVYITTPSGGLVRIELETGAATTIATLEGGYAIRLIVDRAGKTALAHGHKGAIHLVDLTSGAVRTVGQQPAMPGWAEFSPSGRLAATAGTDATVRVIDVASGKQRILRGHEDSIYQARFSADEEVLVSASDDGTARVWHLDSDNVRVLRGHRDDVLSAALRVDRGMLATASLDGSLRLWSLEFGDGRLLRGPGGERQMVRFDEGGTELVVAGDGGVVRRWNLNSGEQRDIHLPWDRDVEKGYNYLQLFGSYAVSVANDRALAVHDLDTGAVTALSGHLDAKPIALSGSKDGEVIAAVYGEGQVRVWRLARPAEPRVIDRDGELHGGALSPDGNKLVVAVDQNLELIDLESGRTSAGPHSEHPPVTGSVDLAAAGCEVAGQLRMHFSPDGSKIAIVSKDNSGLIWNTVTGDTTAVAVELLGMISTAFSPDSRYLASAMSDRTVRLFDTESGEMRVLEGHRDLVMRVEFSPDGQLLASSAYDKTVRLWDVKTGETVRVLRGHNASVDGLGFSPDGEKLASAGRDGTVRVWQLADLPSHEVSAVAERLRHATSAVVAQDQDIVATPQSL